jgi:hypothetical protein
MSQKPVANHRVLCQRLGRFAARPRWRNNFLPLFVLLAGIGLSSPALARHKEPPVQPGEADSEVKEISPKSEQGLSLGAIKAGTVMRLQYVSGRWKAWGKFASACPDDANEHERGDTNRLAIVNLPASGPAETLAVVPTGTAEKPFEFTAPRDLENVALRIKGGQGDWTKNPDGHVKYRVTVLGQQQTAKASHHRSRTSHADETIVARADAKGDGQRETNNGNRIQPDTGADAGASIAGCYAKVGPVLQSADGSLTPQVRKAYLDWAEKTVLEKLRQGNQTVPESCLAEARQDGTLRDALFGSVFPPDPSILQNYAQLCAELGDGFLAKYRSLVIAISVAKRTKGVEKAGTGKDIGRDYQPGFWVDESLQAPGSEAEKEFIRRIANFMKQSHVSAVDLFQKAAPQQQLRADLAKHNVPSGLIAEVKKSIPFGERLKNAMVLLGQRPAAREPKPVTTAWLRHLAAIYEARPTSTPTVNGKALPWPLFPLDKAPWPLLMPLAHPVPLGEAKYIWEKFLGKHGPNGYQDYGPYRAGEDGALAIISDELRPSKWFWDAWPDVMVHGGACVPLSKATVELYSALGKPVMWAGQPGHSNVISFQSVGGAWTAEVEQGATGGPDVTTGQWYFDEDPGTQIRFRDLYYWPFSEYHLGLALGMNVGLKSTMDTRLAEKLFGALPAADKPTLGVKLLRSALRANPCNPAVWYRLAEQTSDAQEGAALAAAARAGDPGRLFGNPGGKERHAVDAAVQARIGDYWHTVAPVVAQYTLLSHKYRLLIGQVAHVIPADLITVTASSVFSDDQLAKHLVDGSGMTGAGSAFHDNEEDAKTMWHTVNRPGPTPPAQGLSPSPAWVRFDFAQPQPFATILIWNHNQAKLTDRGFRKTRIYGSIDGIAWEPLTSSPSVELPRANGSPLGEPTAVPNTSAGQRFTSVIIAAQAAGGNYGGDAYGLSAVRFLQAAVPASPAVATLAVQPRETGTAEGRKRTETVSRNDTSTVPAESASTEGKSAAKELTPAEKMAVADVLLGTWTVEKTNGYRGTWTFTSDGKVTNSDRRPLTTHWTIESGAVMIRWSHKLWESLTLPIDPAGSTGPCWQGTAKAVKVK